MQALPPALVSNSTFKMVRRYKVTLCTTLVIGHSDHKATNHTCAQNAFNAYNIAFGILTLCLCSWLVLFDSTGFSSNGISTPVSEGGDALEFLPDTGEGDTTLFYFSIVGGSIGANPMGGNLINYTFEEEDIGKTFCISKVTASGDAGSPLTTGGGLACST